MANEKRLTWKRSIDGYEDVGLREGVTVGEAICKLADLEERDAVEVVHGEWIYHECVSSHDGAISGYSCSKCCIFVDEEIFDMDEFHKDFCGHCGAKMDGENK